MVSILSSAAILSSTFAALVAAQGQVIGPACQTGIQVVVVQGTGVPNGTYGLSTDIAWSLVNAIPGSAMMSWDYNRFPPNNDIDDYFTIEIQTAVPQLRQALLNYANACPQTPIVLHGYSQGAVVVSNMICGSNWWGVPSNNPLDASLANHIIGIYNYGDETYAPGLEYSRGGCTADAPYLPRTSTAGCSAFLPVMEVYCLPNDSDCCVTANDNVPTIDGNPWHWEYPLYFDNEITQNVINRYNNFINGIGQSAIAAPSTVASVGSYKFQGCYTDSSTSRSLIGPGTTTETMSVEQCASLCSGYLIFGVEDANQCFCGNYLTSGTSVANANECLSNCAGSLTEICGGPNRMNIYAVSGANLTPGATTTVAGKPTTTFITATAAATTVTPKATATSTALPSGVISLGCYVDSSSRALPYTAYGNSSNTPTFCATVCSAAGYPFAGTENGMQCYCGDVAPLTAADSSTCNYACAGNSALTCGGGWRLSITQDTNLLSASGLPSGVSRLGCYVDSSSRLLPNRIYTASNNTETECATQCRLQGYPYSGTEYSQECWCGYSAPPTTSAAPPSDCSSTCPGDNTQLCGQNWRLSVAVNNNAVSPIVNPGAGGLTLQGCYMDSATRILGNIVTVSSMTVANCVSACTSAGYSYCGVEDGNQCFGGNGAPSANLLAAGPVADMIGAGGCSIPCASNSTESCGGGWRVLIYH